MPRLTAAEIDQDNQYAALEATNIATMQAALLDFKASMLYPSRVGRRTLYHLLVGTMPQQTNFMASGLVTVPAGTVNTPGFLPFGPAPFGERITGFEVWNYDSANPLAVDIASETGIYGADLYIRQGTYYTKDVSLPPDAVFALKNAAAAPVAAQIVLTGF